MRIEQFILSAQSSARVTLLRVLFPYTTDLQVALPTLLPELIEHFASRKGYTIHDDVLPCLKELQKTNLKLGIISNSDPRTMKVMESLGIVPAYISPDQ